jgi:hypothetical protein
MLMKFPGAGGIKFPELTVSASGVWIGVLLFTSHET